MEECTPNWEKLKAGEGVHSSPVDRQALRSSVFFAIALFSFSFSFPLSLSLPLLHFFFFFFF